MTEPRLTDTDIDWVEADLNALAIFHGNIVALRGAQALRQVRGDLKAVTEARDLARVGEAQFKLERDTAREHARGLREALQNLVYWISDGRHGTYLDAIGAGRAALAASEQEEK